MLARMRSNRNSHLLLVGTQSGYSHFRRQCGSLTKLNMLFPYNLVIVLLGIYTNGLKTCLQKNLYTDIYSSFIIFIISLDTPLGIRPMRQQGPELRQQSLTPCTTAGTLENIVISNTTPLSWPGFSSLQFAKPFPTNLTLFYFCYCLFCTSLGASVIF